MAYESLVIAPHIDDEVLGCFSALGEKCFVVYCGSDESSIKDLEWVKPRPSTVQRLGELDALQKRKMFGYELLTNKVNCYTVQELIPSFEKHINIVKPQSIYIPIPSYNQDHRAAYEAALTALRPHDMNHFVPRVFVYEQIQDLWNHNGQPFSPNCFRSIDIDEKIECYKTLASQVRGFRSPEMLRQLAAVRGIQGNMPFAEAFQIIRWVER